MALAPPPIQTPLLDSRGRLTTVWIAWFLALAGTSSSGGGGTGSAAISEGPHVARLAAAGLPVGSLWYETDRRVTYALTAAGWQFAGGEQAAASADRPADLAAGDAGYAFVATDTNILYSWSGSTWLQLTGAGGTPVWGPSASNFRWGPVTTGQSQLVWGQPTSGATIVWG